MTASRCPLCNDRGTYPSQHRPGAMLVCTRCEAGGREAAKLGRRQHRDAPDRQSGHIARAPTTEAQDAALQAEVAATLDACNAAWGRTIERHTSPGEFRALTNDELSELTRNLRNPHTPADWPIRQLGRHTDPAPDKSAAVALAIYATLLLTSVAWLALFGLAQRAGWVVVP